MLIQGASESQTVSVLSLLKPKRFNAPASWTAVPDQRQPSVPSSVPKSDVPAPDFEALEKGREAGPLDEDRTLTNQEAEEYVKRPAYYNPNTQEASTLSGLLMSGALAALSLGLIHDDPRYMNDEGKVAYYGSEALANAVVGYGLGALAGEGAGVASDVLRGTRVGRAAAGLVGKVPKSALRGIINGGIVGLEAAKGVEMKEHGASWGDVIGSTVADFAGLYGFTRGFEDAKLNRIIVREHNLLDGQQIHRQIDVFQRGKLIRSVRQVEKVLPNGDMLNGRSLYIPGDGTAIKIDVNGKRLVNLELVNYPGVSEDVPTVPSKKLGIVIRKLESGDVEIKFWKKSDGVGTRFYLYDPLKESPQAQQALDRSGVRMEVPGIRAVMEELKPRPLLSPPPVPESIELLGRAGLELVRFGSGFRQGQESKLSLRVTPVQVQGQKQRQVTKVDFGTKSLQRVRLSRQGALLAMRPRKVRATKTRTKSLLNMKPPRPPRLSGAFPHFFTKKKKHKKLRKKGKGKKKGWQVLGEVDLLTQDILEQERVVAYKVDTKKFRRLWDSGAIWGGEGLDLVKSVKKVKGGLL